ncbi:flagellar hook-associated protein FlgL [Candidatus Hydrogenedentota bacterium]
MGVRISSRTLIEEVLANLRFGHNRLAKFQEQLATGKSINRPSDDPTAVRRAMNLRTNIKNNDRFMENLSMAGRFVDATSSALDVTVASVQRLRELTVRAANDTNSLTEREAIAAEVDEMIEGIIDLGNTTSGTRKLFSGTRTATTPFVATWGLVGGKQRVTGLLPYAGNTDNISVKTGPGLSMTINQDASNLYVNLINASIGIRDDLLADNSGSLQNVRIGQLDTQIDGILDVLATVGATGNRIDVLTQRYESLEVDMETYLSDTEDADFVEVMVELNQQENAYRAALDASARVLQPSLLDFIR